MDKFYSVLLYFHSLNYFITKSIILVGKNKAVKFQYQAGKIRALQATHKAKETPALSGTE